MVFHESLNPERKFSLAIPLVFIAILGGTTGVVSLADSFSARGTYASNPQVMLAQSAAPSTSGATSGGQCQTTYESCLRTANSDVLRERCESNWKSCVANKCVEKDTAKADSCPQDSDCEMSCTESVSSTGGLLSCCKGGPQHINMCRKEVDGKCGAVLTKLPGGGIGSTDLTQADVEDMQEGIRMTQGQIAALEAEKVQFEASANAIGYDSDNLFPQQAKLDALNQQLTTQETAYDKISEIVNRPVTIKEIGPNGPYYTDSSGQPITPTGKQYNLYEQTYKEVGPNGPYNTNSSGEAISPTGKQPEFYAPPTNSTFQENPQYANWDVTDSRLAQLESVNQRINDLSIASANNPDFFTSDQSRELAGLENERRWLQNQLLPKADGSWTQQPGAFESDDNSNPLASAQPPAKTRSLRPDPRETPPASPATPPGTPDPKPQTPPGVTCVGVSQGDCWAKQQTPPGKQQTPPGGGQKTPDGGGGGGTIGKALGPMLEGLLKALGAPQPPSAPAQACSTDPNLYAQQQQQYQQQLQQYNYQLQQQQYQQQLNQYYAERNGGVPPPTQPPPVQPTPCTPSTGSQCKAQPQQPPASACSAGAWRATYSGACISGWQCISTEGPKAELSCEPEVADVGATLAITYGCSSGVASSSSFTVTTQPGGSATTTVKAPPRGTNTATYTLACTDNAKTTGAQCSVQVNKPSIILVANPKTVPANGTSLLSWLTTGMDSCVISSPDQADFTLRNSSNTSVTGAATTSPVTGSAGFLLHCETLAGGIRDATTTIQVQ